MSAFLRLSLILTMTILSDSKKSSPSTISSPLESIKVVDNEPLVPKDVKDHFVFSTGTFFSEHDPRKNPRFVSTKKNAKNEYTQDYSLNNSNKRTTIHIIQISRHTQQHTVSTSYTLYFLENLSLRERERERIKVLKKTMGNLCSSRPICEEGYI